MMDDVSVSKGSFVYVKHKIGNKNKKKEDSYRHETWYKTFRKIWSSVEAAVAEANNSTFKKILSDLENFVSKIKDLRTSMDEIPVGILLTGINLNDHAALLNKFVYRLKSITSCTATVWSRDANVLKNLIEETVYQIITGLKQETDLDGTITEIKKNQCTFCTLEAWHKENNNVQMPIVIIIPDFESFSPKIIRDFILILSAYSQTMKFILIFGVATTLHVVHRSLSYEATSKLNIQVFHTQTEVQSISNILDKIILSPNIPFLLTGKAFSLLVEMFLYYDFSVHSFLQNYKMCLWKHFYRRNEKSICLDPDNVNKQICFLTPKDLQKLKQLPSVGNYLESTDKIGISDLEFKEVLTECLNNIHNHINNFLLVLKCLYKFTENLPGSPFGRNFREIYARSVTNVNIYETQTYKEAIQLLGLLSKEDLLSVIESVILILENHENYEPSLQDFVNQLKYHLNFIKNANLDVTYNPDINNESENLKKRSEWKETLKYKSLNTRSSPYKNAQMNFIKYLDENIFVKYLESPSRIPLNEIFCYYDSVEVNHYVKGSMKAVIHSALNEPHSFFSCDCCALSKSTNEILPNHLDINIIYKLHLESRKMINLYDWLQSFVAMIGAYKNNGDEDIDPVLHARFTRAVAELQFLGFIKATRRKTDHVKRLT